MGGIDEMFVSFSSCDTYAQPLILMMERRWNGWTLEWVDRLGRTSLHDSKKRVQQQTIIRPSDYARGDLIQSSSGSLFARMFVDFVKTNVFFYENKHDTICIMHCSAL